MLRKALQDAELDVVKADIEADVFIAKQPDVYFAVGRDSILICHKNIPVLYLYTPEIRQGQGCAYEEASCNPAWFTGFGNSISRLSIRSSTIRCDGIDRRSRKVVRLLTQNH